MKNQKATLTSGLVLWRNVGVFSALAYACGTADVIAGRTSCTT